MYLNHVQLIGFLGKDPEKRQVRGNGANFTVLSVATQQSWKDANEEWQSKTEWHRVVAFNRLGESISDYACEVLQAWKKDQASKSPYVFPSPVCPDRPISTVKTAWQATLRRAGVPRFPLYTLRHVFCTRLSEVAPDAVVQRAMRHTSPETKRRYQLGMADQVRQAMERANESAYGKGKRTTFLLRSAAGGKEEPKAVSN